MSDARGALEALEVAESVARAAASLLREAPERGMEIRGKSNVRDLVTEWDLRVEELIVGGLREKMPGVAVLAEESGADGDVEGSAAWLVDPIDGTVNFAHGLPLYAVSLALEVDGEVIAGAVAAPALGWLFSAARGHGATVDGRPLAVSRVDALERALVVSGFPYDLAETGKNFAEWEHFQRRAGACRRLGAASLDLCFVARGWMDGYWESELKPWDVGAGSLLVTEAGGTISDLRGGPFRARGGEVLATNGALHEAMLGELAAVRERS